MKIRAFIKILFQQMYREWFTILLVFAIFPIAFSGMLAFFQRDDFTPNPHIGKIEINVIDEDNSQYSQGLESFLKSNELGHIIDVKEDKETKYQLIIPKGYGQGLLLGEEISIVLNLGDKASITSTKIITDIVNRYNEEVSQQILLLQRIDKKTASQQDQIELQNRIIESINKIYNTDAIEGYIVEDKTTLTSFEYYSISLLGYMLIMLILTSTAGFYLEMENGMFERILSTSISKRQYLNYGLVNVFIQSIILNLLYVFVYRATGLSFTGSMKTLILLVLAQSLLATSVGGFFVAYFKKKIAMIVINGLLIIQMVIGAGALPLGKVTGSSLLQAIGNYSPDILISRAYRNYVIYDSFQSVYMFLVAMIVLSIIFYTLSIMKVNLKWGEK